MAAAAVLKGGALLLSCKTWCFRSTRTSLSSSHGNGNGAVVGSLLLKRTIRASFSPSPSQFFRRASVKATTAAYTSSASDAPLASSVPSADSALDAPQPQGDSGAERPAPSAAPSPDQLKDAVDALDFRVGRILRAWRHPEADSLYVEEVDLGEPEPRTICSGLVKYIPLDDLQGRQVVVLANLKPRNMRGVKSSGMLLAASDASHENVELLLPPEASVPGERIWFGSEENKETQLAPVTPNQIQKKKIWELVQPHLKTDDSCVAAIGIHPMRTSAGMVVSRSLKNANIS
ncbi:PREDICTED: aminoacyl tRNA synthase complex-interacting multifunctional protein 1 [Nelumbo nucifera]|uniref:Aminoacyl tRNA synthase complex-interacting multifunctional protein 1 n=2 Tax=Nelumbo nucifera TaxID=4432 RepID=A0A1U8BM68_NELNU|nr:PREDICTED: aminoacyl tRNA synthase complex-interacting multifunctional protein 1 [Nelumbo nucifera]DAD46351.1 TPA_asm: hypothetical protein HUJ06_004581 [Nelumbo nucifera]